MMPKKLVYFSLAAMIAFSASIIFVIVRLCSFSIVPPSLAVAEPTAADAADATITTNFAGNASSNYWVSAIKRQGKVPFKIENYEVFRNVKAYGAVGDGKTDDTAAINRAVSDGNRCGQGCLSSTLSPAIVYFPPGTYLVSEPIIQYYLTQFVGDAISLPILKATPEFIGIAVIDSNPYLAGGANWYTNTNNFYRQVRNFVIDLTAVPPLGGIGIHWQVAQGTSLQNIRFEMVQGGGEGNNQQGIFMENGSGGFMTDLIFNGGKYGAFLGNQQFTTRRLHFNNVQTAIYMNWNWLWAFKSLSINNCGVGINISSNGVNESVGSVLVQDSKIVNTPQGIVTSFTSQSSPPAGGTLVIDNVDFSGSTAAVASIDGKLVLAGGSRVASWVQGHGYTAESTGSATNSTCAGTNPSAASKDLRGSLTTVPKPRSLLNSDGSVFERARPQYEGLPISSFVSVKSNGAKGDGITDDTAAIQKIFNTTPLNKVVYFDYGAYVVSKTIRVPKQIKITGEIWPLIVASGTAFSDQKHPAPVFQVGQGGDSGHVEISDLIFTTKGPQPGAILIEWNLAKPAGTQGQSGMWDVHTRVGGTIGTGLQTETCAAQKSGGTISANPKCEGVFLMLHITSTASVYLENTWFWTADHDLDQSGENQLNIYTGRGVLVESQGPVWMYGTSAEHNTLYNYQIAHAKDIYMNGIQTETPYMQSNPDALTPFAPQSTFSDPTFSTCTNSRCRKSWGIRIFASSNVLVYGAGLYSFFDSYSTTCLSTESCQDHILAVDCSTDVYLYALSTKASTSMVTIDGTGVVPQSENKDTFCSTVAMFSME